MVVDHQKSCGVIVFHREKAKNPEFKFLILHYEEGHFEYPKGHVEPEDLTEEDTAKRELFEETGIKDINILSGFKRTIAYRFKAGKKFVSKKVVFFLGETNDSQVIISEEHRDFFWLPFEKAYEKVTYKTSKELLKIANEFLNKAI